MVTVVLSSVCCANAPSELGGECDATADAPCVEGLQCIVTSGEAPDSGGALVCSEGASFCSTSCALDEDCDEGQICILNCDDGDGGSTVSGACFVGSSQ